MEASATAHKPAVDQTDSRGVFDDGLVLYARGPKSYTGEDTAEITCHGNPQIVERLLAAAVEYSALSATG